jgi:NADH dehydrogenase
MDTRRQVVVVGGGFTGVKAALVAARQDDVDVTLISKSNSLLPYPTTALILSGRDVSGLAVSIKESIAAFSQITLKIDEIIDIDPLKKTVIGRKKDYQYDELVLAVGQTPPFRATNTRSHRSYDGTTGGLKRFTHDLHNLVATDVGHDVTVAVVGGGKNGVEVAGTLREQVEQIALAHHVHRTKVTIVLYEKKARLLPKFSETASRKVAKRLQKAGVIIKTRSTFYSSDNMQTLINHQQRPTDMVIWTTAAEPQPLIREHRDMFHVSKDGRVTVNDRNEAYPHIFAVGGCARQPKRHLTHIRMLGRWAYVEWRGVYVAGLAGAVVSRLIDIDALSQILPLRQAYQAWRNQRNSAEICQLCQRYVKKSDNL